MARVYVCISAVLVCLIGCAEPASMELADLRIWETRPPKVKAVALKEPRFLYDKEFTCATFAEAINYYVALGEEAAGRELEALVASKDGHMADGVEVRMAHVCRILFQSKGNEPLRPPGFGTILTLPENSMPLEKWPLYPVAHAGSSYFVLGEGYLLAGVAESSKDYLQ